MVSPEKNKKNPGTEFTVFLKNTSSRKKKKVSSLLKSKKIFLYFKNHQTLSKHETQLKSYGAVIVPFLDQDVSFVLTDVPGCNGKSSAVADNSSVLSPICYSVSPATSVSGDDNVNKKSRTRAEAMLERVPTQSQSVTAVNPISNAISWKIPVYSVEVFQNWLAKKLSQIQLIPDRSETTGDFNAKIFSKRFLKVESLVKNKYRPEFREVSRWPSIHLNTLAGSCPFDKKSSKKLAKRDRNHADKKKESDRMNRTCNKVTNESGYCEICAVHYKDLSQHVTESTHLKFVCNDKNYADLDNCMKTRSVDAFLAAHSSSAVNSQVKESDNIEEMGRNLRKSVSLHLNNNNENSAVTKALSNSKLLDESLKQPLQVQCNGFANYHLRRTTIKSDGVCYDGRDLLRESRKMYASCPDGSPNAKDLSQLSPLEDDSLHRLRSRRNLILPSILIGTTAEDATRHRSLSSSRNAPSNHYLRSSVSPKGCATRSKPPNHVTDEAAAYRKVFNSASAGLVTTTPAKEARQSAGAHFTRSKLNLSPTDSDRRPETSPGRPTKRKPSVTASDDDEPRNGAASPSAFGAGYPLTKKFKIALCGNLSNHTVADDGAGNHRKRLSAEEKFLEDNKAYYKVEMLRTKLRSTESYCSQALCAPKRDDSAAAEEAGNSAAKATDERTNKLPKRNSALQLLNLEAEKFMFGSPKHDDSEDDDDDDDRACRTNGESRALDDEPKANGFAKQNGRRAKGKKRRTHAELFIHDNLDYYKFEISGSRLRQHGDQSGSGSVKSETNSCSSFEATAATTSGVTRIKDEILTDDESEVALPGALRARRSRGGAKATGDGVQNRVAPSVASPAHQSTLAGGRDEASDCAPSSDASSCLAASLPPPEAICFSFESVPSKEPWYRAFQRYDACDEQCLRVPRTVYFSRYRDIRPLSAGRREKQSAGAAKETSSASNSLLAQHLRRKGRQKVIGGRVVIDDKPRKSPRCHASTLAILSSLTSHRRRARKLHALETKKSSPSGVPRAKVAEAPAKTAAELSAERQRRLCEALGALAKEADEQLVEVFGRDDCEDRYLRAAGKLAEACGHEWRTCLLVDESILRDDETLRCFAEGSLFSGDGGAAAVDMGAFMESAQRCTSMETAEEEWSGARQQTNEALSRLCRENEFSCNSSDCGASSTCEFLGFSEDGRSVSRRRKRKRPNMTGWPKRRHMRLLERRRMAHGDEPAGDAASEPSPRAKGTGASSAATTEASSETALGEADSECSEDDVPLVQIMNRKRRRANSTTASTEDSSKEETNAKSGPRAGRKFALKRRKCKASPAKTSPRVATRGLAASPRRRGRRLPLSRRNR